MTDRRDQDVPPETFADLPIQPTGSGVADLEIAYEQMKLAEDAEGSPAFDPAPVDRAASERGGEDEAETAAHPS